MKARKTGNREPVSVILIVCEGEKTEPGYFEQFPVAKDVREIRGLGMDPLRLVQEARELQREFRKRRGYDYGQVWCVFDRDEFPLDRFNQALQLATTSGFQVVSMSLWGTIGNENMLNSRPMVGTKVEQYLVL